MKEPWLSIAIAVPCLTLGVLLFGVLPTMVFEHYKSLEIPRPLPIVYKDGHFWNVKSVTKYRTDLIHHDKCCNQKLENSQ